MAAPATPTPHNWFQQRKGRFFLGLARLVQRTLAHRRTRFDVGLRNRAMRAAHACGIDQHTITREVGVSEATTRKVLGKKPVGE